MVKIDKIELKKQEKKMVICLGLISAILCCYSLLFAAGAILWNRLKKDKRLLTATYGLVITGNIFYIILSQYTLADFIRPYFSFYKNLFLIDPVRMTIAAAYGIMFLYMGHLLSEGIDDWVVEEKKEQADELLPPGKFNFWSWVHMLLWGTTGSGKGVVLNHMIKNVLERGLPLIMISAKLASTDPYSQLAYIRELAKKHKRKLYVVSMDPDVDDKYLYNPFRYIDKTEMQNALENMIKTDSHFYKSNFVAWVLSIFKALRAAGEEVTLSRILDLYEYKSYEAYVKRMRAEGRIKHPSRYLNSKIKRYAVTAANDSANLDLIFEAGEEVFDDSWIRPSISIMDALAENAIIYFDLNGNSAKAATSLIGSCIIAEIQHATKIYCDPEIKKLCIADEAAAYMNEMFVSCLSLARSAGYKFVISTQGPSDLKGPGNDERILSQIVNNTNQFGILRMNDPKDAEEAGEVVGTAMRTENTRRADGIEYEGTGSIKPVPVMIANPNTIKNLPKLNMIYYEKTDDPESEPKAVMVKWRTDDL